MSKFIVLAFALMSCMLQRATQPSPADVSTLDVAAFARQNGLLYVKTEGMITDNQVFVGNEKGVAVILVDPADPAKINQAFVVQGASGLRLDMQNMEIAYNKSGGGLLKAGGKLYGLRLQGYTGFFDLVKEPVQVVEGIGWARYTLGADRTTFINHLQSGGFPAAYAAAGGVPPILSLPCAMCGSGGEGAIQCQTESATVGCEVTCRTGFFACCNILMGCVCCKER